MARKVSVSGAVVREWLNAQGEAVGSRGRLSAAQVEAFEKATGQRYEVGHTPKVEVKGIRISASGRKVPVALKVAPADLRAFAVANGGGLRGRISGDIRAQFAARPKV